MEPQIKHKIPADYQEAFQLGSLGDFPTARNIVFNLLEAKLDLFGLVWSVAIFCPHDALGYDRWLRRASKILEDHRKSENKTVEEEVLDLIERYMRIRSRENILYSIIPNAMANIEEVMKNLGIIITKHINDEKAHWIRLLKAVFLWDVLDTANIALQTEDPEQLTEEIIKYDQSNEYYHYLKALIQHEDNGVESALKLNPLFALAYFQQAISDVNQGYSDEETISLLDKAIEISPRFAEAHFAKAMALKYRSVMKHKDDIIKHMNIAISLDPENADYHYKKGFLLVDLESYDEALICLHDCLKFEPTYGEAYNQIAYIHIMQRQFVEAIKAYLNAIKLCSEVKPNVQNIQRAINDLQKKGSTDVQSIQEDVIQFFASLRPTSQSVKPIVDYLRNHGKEEDALKFIERAENPSLVINYQAGHLLKKLGRYQEAIERFQKILDATEDRNWQAEANEAIGWIYANKLQDSKIGLDYIVKAMTMKNNYPKGIMMSVRDPTEPEAGEFIIQLK